MNNSIFRLGFLLTVLLASTGGDALAQTESADFDLRDEARARGIECRVYYPESGTSLPLIVFSHGFGADRTAFEVVARHWAQGGYVVVLPSHIDGAGKSAGKSLPPAPAVQSAGQPAPVASRLQSMLGDPVKTENRVEDVLLVMSETAQLVAAVPALKNRIDTGRIGVGGHSFGAYIASLLGGVTVDIGGQSARSFADERVRCILPISAQGTGQQGLTETSWQKLAKPMMTITGSRDQGAGGQTADWKKQPYEYSPAGDKFLLFVEGANHVSFGGYGGRDNSFTPVVKAATLAFWNAYLKDDAAAKASLVDGTVLSPFGAAAMLESK